MSEEQEIQITVKPRQRIQRQLPNGEFVWVDVPDDYQGEMQPLNVPLPARQVAGQNGCPHCGQVFVSPGTLDSHIQAFHMIASGKADVRAVELPDGTSVPVSLVPEIVDEAKQKQTAAEAVLEENEQLKKKVAELEAFAAEQITAKPGWRYRSK
jgi:hypothetical protein